VLALCIACADTGINLGQVFESDDYNRPRDATNVSPLLLAFKQEGFKHVRIPVTWFPDATGGAAGRCRLDDTTFMSQLENAIFYSINVLG
jgi:hypothetical protein